MKLHWGTPTTLLSTVFVAVNVVSGQTIYTCPIEGSAGTVLPAETTIRIPIITNADTLCTLVRHNITAGGSQRAPVARSFAARGSWEVSAGLFSNGATSGLTLDCASGDGTMCDITLPPVRSGEEYILETSTRSSVSSDTAYTEDELKAARFLEQSTFGPTVDSIDQLVANGLDFESWLMDQMYNLPKSSLREYYRRRVNPKFEFPYRVGAVGAGPCDTNSRWRMYAVSIWTHLMSIILMWYHITNMHLTYFYLPHSYHFRFPQGTCSFLVALTLRSI